MSDGQNDVVENALNECAEEFVLGVHSFYAQLPSSELTIDDGVIGALKGTLRQTFEEHLEHKDPAQRRAWEKDKE